MIKNKVKVTTPFSFNEASLADIEKKIFRQNLKKVGISQDIPPKLLKNSIYLCSETLKQIFYDIAIYCEFPNELKKAVVTPIFKKAKNYKPVSVLLVLKVFKE